jgi:phospholipid/cholesterol/gamma-HCH transport system substrate-binding protein
MGLKKNSEIFSEVIVGVFMIAVLALLGYFTIIISGVELFNGNGKVPVTVRFQDVGGLRVSDSVVLRGMPVGSVTDMRLEDSGVKVSLAVGKDVKFKEGYVITVCSGSLLGGNYLLIEEGKGAEMPKGAELAGQAPSNWLRELSEIVGKLKEATEGDHLKKIVSNIEEASGSIKALAARVEDGKGTLGKLFAEDNALYNDLSNTVANLKSVTARIDSGTNSLGRLLNDDGCVYGDLKSSIANLKSISERLEKGEGTVGKLLSSDDTIYRDLQETMERIKSVAVRLDNGEGTLGKLMKDDNKVYNDLDATVANLKLVTDRLAKGEGTLGKLSADEQLYNDVHGLVKDVRQTVDNFRDTTPISAFASLLMGGL